MFSGFRAWIVSALIAVAFFFLSLARAFNAGKNQERARQMEEAEAARRRADQAARAFDRDGAKARLERGDF